MKKTILFIVGLLLYAQNSSAVTSISNLPFSCTVPNETYVLSQNLESLNGNAIIIKADNVVLDGQHNSLTYGLDGEGIGILVGGYSNIEIKNLHLFQGKNGGHAIDTQWATPHNLRIHDNTFYSERVAQSVIFFREFNEPVAFFSIKNNIIFLNDDVQGAAKAIDINPKASLAGEISNNTITIGQKIYKNRNSGISIVGGIKGTVTISNNTLNMNSMAEGEGIRLYASDNNEIIDNTINMNCFDCRGILLDGGSDYTKVSSNKIFMNIKTGGNSLSYGLRVRFSSSHNEITKNLIDASQSDENTKPVTVGIGGTQSETPGICKDNFFKGNIFTTPRYYTIYINQGSINTVFDANTITSTNASTPIFIRPMPGGETIEGLKIRYNRISYESEYAVWFDFYYTHTKDLVSICGSDPKISDSEIRGGIRNADYSRWCTP